MNIKKVKIYFVLGIAMIAIIVIMKSPSYLQI